MRLKLVAMTVILVFFAGASCSPSTEDKRQASANSANAMTANANTVAISNGSAVQPPVTADANAAPAASSDALADPGNRMQAKLDDLRKSAGSAGTVDAATLAKQNARPAPDNSTFTSYLTDAGYEIRTFKSHPQLLRVERKVAADGKQTVKVFLRNGKVVDLPGQSLSPLATVSADSIMQAAGVQVPPAQPSGPVPTKKSGE